MDQPEDRPVDASDRDRPSHCPRCGSTSIVPALHGKQNDVGMARARRGEVVLAGCDAHHIRWGCAACKYLFQDRDSSG
jgi:transposase-like protein